MKFSLGLVPCVFLSVAPGPAVFMANLEPACTCLNTIITAVAALMATWLTIYCTDSESAILALFFL